MKTIKLIGVFVALIFLMSCAGLPVQPESPATIPGTLGDTLLVYDEWDGLLNPHDFRNWQVLGHRPCPDGYRDYHILLQNPEDKPDTVEIGVVPGENEKQIILVWYKYEADKVSYVFSVTVENKTKYNQVKPKGHNEYL